MTDAQNKATEAPALMRTFMDRLNQAEQQALVENSCQERYAEGAIICYEGDPGDAVYIVQSGQIAVLKEMSDGRPTLLGNRGPGEILGEMSLVSDQPRSATLIAEEESDLLTIRTSGFPAIMNNYPGINWAILNVLNDRLHEANRVRAAVAQEEESLAQKLERLTGKAEQSAELARARQETIESIAHDLRTPLTVIDGCLQMLSNSLPDEALESSSSILTLAMESTGRLMSLIHELLGAARREVPAAELVRRPVYLGALFQAVAESALVTAEEINIRLDVSVPPDLPQPLGDLLKLERMVTNLVDNALSYTPKGGRIVLAAEQRGPEIKVSVTDTGPGVPSEYRDVIFERFTRVPQAKSRRKGFGLGLHFCKQVAEAHGGRIWVEPGPNDQGSRFAFTLPLQTSAARD